MDLGLRRLRFTIPAKVSLLVISTVFVSVLAFSVFIFIKVKQEEEKAYAQTVSSLGALMGEQLWRSQEEIKKDMTSILALINPKFPTKSQDSIRIILQKNPQLLYFELSRIDSTTHHELLSLFNENSLTQKAIDRKEIRDQIENDIKEFSREEEHDINYHFSSPANRFPIYIFELDRQQKIFAAFTLSKDAFSGIYNPTSPVDIMLINQPSNDIVFSSSSKDFPVHEFLKSIETLSANRGADERFKPSPTGAEFAIYFYRAADGITLLTYKNLSSAGLDQKSFIRDVVFFFGAVSIIMLLISFVFSKGLTSRIKRIVGLTENMATRLEKVTELAQRDGLTGVYNQKYFRQRLDEIFQDSQQNGRPLSLVLLDIDHYKNFNDEYGHQQGDVVIQQLAYLLLSMTRKVDLVGRLGGDEFAVLLVDTEPALAQQIAERIREAFQMKRISKFDGDGAVSGTCSVGVANFDGRNFLSSTEFIKLADDYLYRAKRSGRNQVYSG